MNTRRTLAITAIATASLTVAACSGGEPPAGGRVADVVAMPPESGIQLAQLLDQFDPVALGDLLTEDARLLPPNIPAIDGRDAIVEHYKGVVAAELDYEVTPLRSAMIGNVGIAEGTYRVKNLTNDTYVEDGKYMAVWVNRDGEWKVARMMVNTDYQVARASVSVEEPAAAETPTGGQ